MRSSKSVPLTVSAALVLAAWSGSDSADQMAAASDLDGDPTGDTDFFAVIYDQGRVPVP